MRNSDKKRNIIGIILVMLIGVVIVSMINTGIKARHGRLGLAEYKKGNYKEAIKNYAAGKKANPKDASLYNNQGLACYALRKYDEAISDYSNAIKLNPNYAKAYFNRGQAYWRKGGYDKTELLEKAISDFSKVIELSPDDMEAYYNRGIAYSSFMHWHKKEIVADSKRSGFTPEATRSFVKALFDFQKVIDSDSPYSALAIAGKANLFYRHANWEVAIEEYKKAIERRDEIIKVVGEEGFGGMYAPMGRTYMALGDMENAFSSYEKFMDLVSNPLLTFHEEGPGLGMGYAVYVAQNLGKYKKAVEWYDRKIAISEKPSAGDYSGKGFCYYTLKEYDKAIASYNKCLELVAEGGKKGGEEESEYGGSPEGDARRYLGLIYKEKGDIEKSKKEFRKAIDIYSRGEKRSRYRYEKGLCYLGLGEYDKAISDFKKILESKKSRNYVMVHKDIGIAYLRMGNKDKAREYFQKTIKFAEEDAKKHRYKEIIQETEKLLKEL